MSEQYPAQREYIKQVLSRPDFGIAYKIGFLFYQFVYWLDRLPFTWYIWQLLPFEYHSIFLDNGDGHYYHSIWRMWFGRCFWIREHRIGLTINNAVKAVNDLRDMFSIGDDVDLVEYVKSRTQ